MATVGFDAGTTVKQMFHAIDAARWRELPKFFSSDCIYDRPGYGPIRGIDALTEFYQRFRPIESGTHVLDVLISQGACTVAVGDFSGKLRDGSCVEVRFADVYRFSGDRIGHRTTYFFQPAV
jgi:uncharacterized protein